MNQSVCFFRLWAVAALALLPIISPISTKAIARTDGNVIKVPDDYATIQSALFAAEDSDTILVATGVYAENLFTTKDITLSGGWDASFTERTPGASIIDGQGLGRVISLLCASGDTTITVDGFTIRNGGADLLGVPEGIATRAMDGPLVQINKLPAYSPNDPVLSLEDEVERRTYLAELAGRDMYPGGQQAYHAMLNHLALRSDQASRALVRADTVNIQPSDPMEVNSGFGGGVFSLNCSLVLENNNLENNIAGENTYGAGGGVFVAFAPPQGVTLRHNFFVGNVGCQEGVGDGGGVYLFQTPEATIANNNFHANIASELGKGQGGGLAIIQSPGAHIDANEFLENTSSNFGDGLGGGLFVSETPDVLIENNVFNQNIAADAGEAVQGFGGGLMVASSANATIRGNAMEFNTANGTWKRGEGRGGGIYLSEVESAVVSENTLLDNMAVLRGIGMGGGLSIYQAEGAWIGGNEIAGNWAAMYQTELDGAGGGIALESSANTTLVNNDIRENTAVVNEEGLPMGGGVAGFNLEGQTQLFENFISSNIACFRGYCQGGGVGLSGVHEVLLLDNIVIDNVTSLHMGLRGVGGGVYLADVLNSQVSRNRFQGNRAGDTTDSQGGGLMVANAENGSGVTSMDANLFLGNQPGGCDIVKMDELSFTNNVVAQNRTSTSGSVGIWLVQDGLLVNNTIVENSYNGIALADSSSLTLVNNIVVSHTVGLVVEAGTTAAISYTLWHGNVSDFAGGGAVIHSHPVYGNPGFINPTAFDYSLASNSPGLDAGDPAGVPPAPDHDLTGLTRPQGLAVDLGAYERSPLLLFLPLVIQTSLSLP